MEMAYNLINSYFVIMKTILTAILLFCAMATTYGPFSVTGTTVTQVMGKTVKQENLTLNLKPTDDGYAFSLKGFSIMGFDNISITGIGYLDSNGNITSWKDVKIKGAPAKVTKLTGHLQPGNADIHMEGKAGGMFKFNIHYVAK